MNVTKGHMTNERKIRRGCIQYVLLVKKYQNKHWGIREIIHRVKWDEVVGERVLSSYIITSYSLPEQIKLILW